MRIGLVTFLITLVIDQLSKILIVFGLDLKVVQTIEVLPPYLVFRMAWNRGVNFGLFSGESDANRWILIGIALIVVGFVLFWVRSETDKKVFVSTGLLVGGAIGNIIDRILYGAVADFQHRDKQRHRQIGGLWAGHLVSQLQPLNNNLIVSGKFFIIDVIL